MSYRRQYNESLHRKFGFLLSKKKLQQNSYCKPLLAGLLSLFNKTIDFQKANIAELCKCQFKSGLTKLEVILEPQTSAYTVYDLFHLSGFGVSVFLRFGCRAVFAVLPSGTVFVHLRNNVVNFQDLKRLKESFICFKTVNS